MRKPLLRSLLVILPLFAVALGPVPVASGDHFDSSPCRDKKKCAGHEHWPKMTLQDVQRTPMWGNGTLIGRPGRSDQLLGWHGSDKLYGNEKADVLWGDHVYENQPKTQRDLLSGGAGDDFIYSSSGYNTIDGGIGNDAIKARYGKGTVDCGPGRDIVHLPRKRRVNWTFKGCEKFEYRSESAAGSGLKTLP